MSIEALAGTHKAGECSNIGHCQGSSLSAGAKDIFNGIMAEISALMQVPEMALAVSGQAHDGGRANVADVTERSDGRSV